MKKKKKSGDLQLQTFYKFDDSYPSYIPEHNWKPYFATLVINDGIENIEIKYKGITYKFNLQKVLDKLADVVESVEIINNKEDDK